MLTEQQLTAYAALAAEVQAAAAKATPGPWACYNGWGASDDDMHAARIGPATGGGLSTRGVGDICGTRADLEFTAEVRTAAPALAAAVAELVAECRRLAEKQAPFVPFAFVKWMTGEWGNKPDTDYLECMVDGRDVRVTIKRDRIEIMAVAELVTEQRACNSIVIHIDPTPAAALLPTAAAGEREEGSR